MLWVTQNLYTWPEIYSVAKDGMPIDKNSVLVPRALLVISVIQGTCIERCPQISVICGNAAIVTLDCGNAESYMLLHKI